MGNDLLEIILEFKATVFDNEGNPTVIENSTELDFFGVKGVPGLILAHEGTRDGNILKKFNDAKHFKNVHMRKRRNGASYDLMKIYDWKLNFEFRLTVNDHDKRSSFTSISLFAEDAEFEYSLKKDSTNEAFLILFSDSQMDWAHWVYQKGKLVNRTEPVDG